MLIIKTILIIALFSVFIQDIKIRQVYWFLFPVIGFCAGFILFKKTSPYLFLLTTIYNLLFVLLLLTLVALYSKLKLKTTISKTFGLGDALIFIALSFSFFSVSFTVLFIFGLIFSLLIHLIQKKQSSFKTVPLAGYLSLFFIIVYLTNWMGYLKHLYII